MKRKTQRIRLGQWLRTCREAYDRFHNIADRHRPTGEVTRLLANDPLFENAWWTKQSVICIRKRHKVPGPHGGTRTKPQTYIERLPI